MKPNLYICHTAYQVLVDLLRAGRCACENGPHTMVLSASVPDTAALAARLDATGVVKTVLVDETRWPGTVTGLFAHRRAARAFEKLCGWKFDRAAYENVYIHNDWSVLGRYLQDCRAGYILCEDTFELLPRLEKEGHPYDFIILDPPAFTKARRTVENAMRGYKEINYRAMKLLPRGGYLATCSCSHFASEALFIKMLRDAARDAGVQLRQIEARQQCADHPILWGVEETNYLKFFIFQVV